MHHIKRELLQKVKYIEIIVTLLKCFFLQLDVLFGNLPEMVDFQVEFLKTLEDGTRLVPDLEKLERVDQFKVSPLFLKHTRKYMTSNKNLKCP